MIRLKRFIRPGLVISAGGHVAALLAGLAYVGANSFEPPPPPDAMVVDIVPPDEAPRLSGTPSELRTSGSQFNGASAVAQPPPPKPAPQQQPQQHSKPQSNARAAMAQPLTAQAETAHAEKPQSETAQTETSEPSPDPPQPNPEETPDRADAAERLAQLALLGGRLGGGFAAPPVNTMVAGYDFTAAFREHVSSCSALPPGFDTGDKISVALRVFLNRDGTLGPPPQVMEPITSAKQQVLMQSSISALEKCQPYTMLPPAKYKRWKQMDLTFYPLNFFDR